MSEEIKVHVVKYPDRPNLVMRYVDPHTGRQVQRSTGTADHDAAVKAADKWEDDLHNGRYKAPSRVTWEEFRDKYESDVLSSLAKATETRVSGIFDAVEEQINPARRRLVEAAGLPAPRGKSGPQKMRVTVFTMIECSGGNATDFARHSSRSVTDESYIDRRLTAAIGKRAWPLESVRPDLPRQGLLSRLFGRRAAAGGAA